MACHTLPALVDEVLEKTSRASAALSSTAVSAGGRERDRQGCGGATGPAGGCGLCLPSSTALAKLRHRLGTAHFELLLRRLSGPSVPRSAPWSHAFGLLLVAGDGTHVDLADSLKNAKAFARPSRKKGAAGTPSHA